MKFLPECYMITESLKVMSDFPSLDYKGDANVPCYCANTNEN